jgi:hypothetical protein
MKNFLLKLLEPLHRALLRYMGWSGLILYGKGGGAPPAPDYTGAAQASSAASQELATQNTWANRPNQNTPWGSQYWTAEAGFDPATGQKITNWTQNQTLDPALQSALSDQLAIQGGRSDLANQMIGRVASDYSQPFNWGGAPGMAQTPNAQMTGATGQQGYVPQYQLDTGRVGQTTYAAGEPAFSDQRNRIENMAFNRMAPVHQQQQEALNTQLVNQGITPGSQAYNAEQMRLSQQQAGERYNAMEFGGSEQQRMNQQMLGQQQQAFGQAGQIQQLQNAALMSQFGQGLQGGQFTNQAMQNLYNQNLGANAQNFGQQAQQFGMQNQARQQYLAEEAMRRGMSLNELNALMTGQQVQAPNMPGFNTATMGQAPNLLGAAQAQGQYGLGAAQLGQQASNNLWGGIGQLAGTGAMLYGSGAFG